MVKTGVKPVPRQDISFIEIDQNNLDKEWLLQPKLFLKYGTKLADARLDLEEAKAELDVVMAELDQVIRATPEDFGIGKLTEKTVEATIPLQKDYKEALKDVNRAKHAVDVLQATCTALDHRKRSLEKLVDLWSQSYFSTPKAPDGQEEEMRTAEKRVVRQHRTKRG